MATNNFNFCAPNRFRHRETYCVQADGLCHNYMNCLNEHVEVFRLDDRPFRKFTRSKGTCYTKPNDDNTPTVSKSSFGHIASMAHSSTRRGKHE